MRLAPDVERVHNTRDLFQINVVSLYQNPQNNSQWGNWPSKYMQNLIDREGPIKNYPTVYHGLFQTIPIKAMKKHPDIDTRHAPGAFVTTPQHENQLYAVCGQPDSLPGGQCTVDVYNTKSHFEYEMYFPGNEVDRTIEIVGAIDKLINSWK
jgi:hypothetical protein